MTYTYTIRWPASASEVYVTGNFDNWSKSVVATSVVDGFAHKVEVPHRQDIVFKFVVDGDWQLNREYATRWEDGVENNVIPAKELEEETEKSAEKNSEKSEFSVQPVPGVTAIPIKKSENSTLDSSHLDKSEDSFKSTSVQPVPGVIRVPFKTKEHPESVETGSEKAEKSEFKSTPVQPVPGVISIPIKKSIPKNAERKSVEAKDNFEAKKGDSEESSEKPEFKSTSVQPVPGVISIPIKRKEIPKESEKKVPEESPKEKGKESEKPDFKSSPTQPVPGVLSIPITRKSAEVDKTVVSEKDKEAPVSEESKNSNENSNKVPNEVSNEVSSKKRASKEASKEASSPSPEDDVLSDFDESVASASSVSKSHEEEEQPSLNQVLTSTSSFAAVSLPSSTDDYHDIGNVQDEPAEEDQFDTPTNSLFNSTVLPAKGDLPESRETQTSSPSLQKSTPESSLSGSRNNSFNKPPLKSHDSAATIPKKDDIVAILKAPGSYPSETTSSTPREEQYTGKRENLVSKFKGLFRY